MAYKDNIYKASDFTFKDGYITCDGLYMMTPRSCSVPKEVLESMKETFRIKLRPGSEFVFNPPTDIDRFFEAMYKPYLRYLEKLLEEKNVEEINESLKDDIQVRLDTRFYLNNDSIIKIAENGRVDVSRILPERITMNDASFMGYYSIDDIVEFGKEVPYEYEEMIEEEYIFFDTEEYFSDVIKESVVKRFANLKESEIGFLVNAPRYNGDKVVCQLLCVDGNYEVKNKNQLIIPIHVEKFGAELNILVDVSGEELVSNCRLSFSEESIEQIDRMIKKTPAGIEKDAFVERLSNIKDGSSKIQIVDFDDAKQYNNINFRKILEEDAMRLFGFMDLNNHDSDYESDYWWGSPSVYTYISVKRCKKPYLGSNVIMMYSCDAKKATYYFYTNQTNYMPLVFAVWAYFGSSISNKRQNFNSSIFKYFGMTYFTK